MTPIEWSGLALAGFLTICLLGNALERRDWNEGRCSCCCHPWENVGLDAPGGRSYKAPCGRHIWISWPGIDRYPLEGKP